MEITVVVRCDPRIDEDLEVLIRDYLTSEGLLDVVEMHRPGLTGTIDLPRVWLPTETKPVPVPPTRPVVSTSGLNLGLGTLWKKR